MCAATVTMNAFVRTNHIYFRLLNHEDCFGFHRCSGFGFGTCAIVGIWGRVVCASCRKTRDSLSTFRPYYHHLLRLPPFLSCHSGLCSHRLSERSLQHCLGGCSFGQWCHELQPRLPRMEVQVRRRQVHLGIVGGTRQGHGGIPPTNQEGQ